MDILKHYQNENLGVRKNLYQLLNHGPLAGTGKLLMYAIDQGFELGPDASFSKNPAAYDPEYHINFAIDANLSGFAAPYGFLSTLSDRHIGRIPLILKINSSNRLVDKKHNPPYQAITGSVKQALEIGCHGIGFTIYPGSDMSLEMFREIQEIAEDAKAHGLIVVIWAYARRGGHDYDASDNAKKDDFDELSLETISYATHMACLLGAHMVKVKIPNENDKVSAITHIVRSGFCGKRLIMFSGGENKDPNAFLDDIKAIKAGGGFGSLVGRNFFQKPYDEALKLAQDAIGVLLG